MENAEGDPEEKKDAVKANSAPAPRTVNKKLQNAARNSGGLAADIPMTRTERAEIGRQRYGLEKKEGEK